MGALLNLERELAGVVSLADLTGSILHGLQRVAGATGSTLFSFQQRGIPITSGGTLGEAMGTYTPDMFAEDTFQHYALRQPGSTFISDGTSTGPQFDVAAHERSRPFVDFYRPLDIGYVLALWPTGLEYGTPNMFGVLLTTRLPFRPFDPKAIAKLRHLEVPLRTAAQRIARFRDLEHKADALAQLLSRHAGSYVLWDADGHLSWMSPSAQLQLASGLRRSDLMVAARAALRQMHHADPATRTTLLGRPQQVRSAHGAPLRATFSWISGSDRRPWLVAELDESAGARARLEQLTQAETRVLRLLAQGFSNAEVSERLDVSMETVKTHVRRILFKLGMGSRAKAVAMANEVWGRSISAPDISSRDNGRH